jgi:hypothetical protein
MSLLTNFVRVEALVRNRRWTRNMSLLTELNPTFSTGGRF